MTDPLKPPANRVALFTTCVVDQILPQVGVATVKLLRRAGFEVAYSEEQTCCGQPFYNSGFLPEARRLAKQTIEILETYSTVVLPSGSCTAMIRKEYRHLLFDQPVWQERAKELAEKTFELTEFLTAEPALQLPVKRGDAQATYHDSCHMCRTLGIKDEPRQLLNQAGFAIQEMEEPDRCCGFGGSFSFKYGDISAAMAEDKVNNIIASGADTVVGCDMGCLMNIQGMLSRQESSIRVMHIAELLAS